VEAEAAGGRDQSPSKILLEKQHEEELKRKEIELWDLR